jgi:arylsulfatase A
MESNRRTFLKSMAVTTVTPAISMQSILADGSKYTAEESHRRPSPSAQPKNVVVMICDDLGYGDLGCYGTGIKTPNLDKLATDGARFTHCDSAHPICSASRAALLTGRYGQRSGTTAAFFPNSKYGLALEETTLANLFKDSGYRTMAIGKWHLGDAPEYLPTKRGFDSYFGVPYSDDMKPLPLMCDTSVLEAETDRDLLTLRYTEEALRLLDEDSAKPFFLYLAFSYPHDPARASARFKGKSGLGDYGDAVQEIDWSVGEVVSALEKKGRLSDTLILFTSDHGPWYQGSPGNLRGRKGTTFEGGVRVPLIAHWPAGIQPGVVSNEWLSNLDILPTLTSLCGLNASPNPLDGIDNSKILRGGRGTAARKAILYFNPMTGFNPALLKQFSPTMTNISEMFNPALGVGTDLHCARRGDWKLRFAQINGEIYVSDYTTGRASFWLARPELYNLALDPTESYDVAHEHPEIVKEILDDVDAQVKTMPEVVQGAYSRLRRNVSAPDTRPGAAPPPNLKTPEPPWQWVPKDRR